VLSYQGRHQGERHDGRIVGATLSFLTPFVTLSFLITTPDAWVSALGDAQHGFP
jgi:uncharacterized membrane protein YkgB